MSVSARRFPLEKSVILNVLYDSLDAIDFGIDESDSARGTFLVSSRSNDNEKMRIVISPSLSERATLLEVFPAGEAEVGELRAVLLGEMDAVIRRAGFNGDHHEK